MSAREVQLLYKRKKNKEKPVELIAHYVSKPLPLLHVILNHFIVMKLLANTFSN